MTLRSAGEVDARDEQYDRSQEELGQLSEVEFPWTQNHQQNDDSQGTEDAGDEGIAGEIVAHDHAIEELASDDRNEVKDEGVDDLGAWRRSGFVDLPEGGHWDLIGGLVGAGLHGGLLGFLAFHN